MKTITVQELSKLFPEVELIQNAAWRDAVYNIWKEVFERSSFEKLTDAGFNPACPGVSLVTHTRGVVKGALALAQVAKELYGTETDQDKLICVCMLHDVSKVLECDLVDGVIKKNELGLSMQHGFYSGYYAEKYGLPLDIVADVVGHSLSSKKVASSLEGIACDYADWAEADYHRFQAGLPLIMERLKK